MVIVIPSTTTKARIVVIKEKFPPSVLFNDALKGGKAQQPMWIMTLKYRMRKMVHNCELPFEIKMLSSHKNLIGAWLLEQ
jgi:hypothetical protein